MGLAELTTEQTLAAMLRFVELAEAEVRAYRGMGHPLDITRDWAAKHHDLAAKLRELSLADASSARESVLASPFEAAVHDAYGKVLGQNSYNLLGPEFVQHDLAHYLTPAFAGEYLDRYTLRQPKAKMPLYHLVGVLDPLVDSDIASRLSDGLPETLGEWICTDGLTHLKIKLNGDDLAWDVERVAGVERVAAEMQASLGVTKWNYSLDFNEKCSGVENIRRSANMKKKPRRRWTACNISNSRRTVISNAIPKTKCTKRPLSSRW